MTAADPALVADVSSYFESQGIDCSIHRTGASLRCSGSAAAVSSMLKADVNQYSHNASGRKINAVLGEYTFPAELEGKCNGVVLLAWWSTQQHFLQLDKFPHAQAK